MTAVINDRFTKMVHNILATPAQDAPLMICEDPSTWEAVQEYVKLLEASIAGERKDATR